jgi:hypothetical protein
MASADPGYAELRRLIEESRARYHLDALVGMTVSQARAVVERAGGEFATALLRRAEVGTPDTGAALELLTAQSALASSSNAMRIRSHMGKSAVIA